METQPFFPHEPEIVRFFTPQETGLSLLMVGYNDFRVVRPYLYDRRQEFCTLHFVLSGRGNLRIDGKIFPVEENDAFFIDDRRSFAYWPDSCAPWDYVWFSFEGKDAPALVRGAGFSEDRPVLPCGQSWKIRAEIAALLQAENRKNLSVFGALSAYYSLLDSLRAKSEERPAGQDYAERAKLYIEEKYFDPEFRVESLCSMLHLSHAQLCRIFRRFVGGTPVDYIAEKRLARARLLLETSSLQAQEIAYVSGFADPDYFYKTFKKRFGQTPSQYRKSRPFPPQDGQ